jgi:hypothetical protein
VNPERRNPPFRILAWSTHQQGGFAIRSEVTKTLRRSENGQAEKQGYGDPNDDDHRCLSSAL